MKTKVMVEDSVLDYHAGSLWYDPTDNELFVLGWGGGGNWVAVSFETGEFWMSPTENAREAVVDLEYFRGKAEVSN